MPENGDDDDDGCAVCGATKFEDGGALVCAGGVLGTEPPADVLEVQADPLAPVRWRVSYGAKTVVYRAKRIASFYPQD